MLYTCMADVVPVANRATVFFQCGAVYLIAALVASPLAAALMIRSPWLAYTVGTGLLILANLLSLLLPETNKLRQRSPKRRDSNGVEDQVNKTGPIQQTLQHIRTSTREAWGFVRVNQRVTFLILTIVFVFMGKWVQEMLLQYATKRYNWKWSQATFLLTVGNASNLVVLMAVLPAISWVLISRLHMSGVAKDLVLARASSIILILGSLVIALAWNGYVLAFGLVVLSFGGGLNSLIRSLANALVEEHHVGILNTLIGLMDQLALVIAGPLLSMTLSAGFDMGGIWVGLPFFCSALMFCVATAVTFLFRMPARKGDDAEGLIEDEEERRRRE